MSYFIPPGAISIIQAVYRLAGRNDDSYDWFSLNRAWQKLRETIRTRKLPGYIVDENGQTHEADCAQFAGLWDYDPIRLTSCEFLAAAPQVHITARPHTSLGILFPYSYSTKRISGELVIMESDFEKVFAKIRRTDTKGSKPKYNWRKIKDHMLKIMNERGEFDGVEWYQERLIGKLLEFCTNAFGKEPARSTLIEDHLPDWLKEWREQQTAE